MIVIWRYHKRELISLQDVFFLKTTIANRYPRGQGILLGPTNSSQSDTIQVTPTFLQYKIRGRFGCIKYASIMRWRI